MFCLFVSFFTATYIAIGSNSAYAAQPSRRTIIQHGERLQQQSKTVKIRNSRNAKVTVYKTKTLPLLGYSFAYPEEWKVHIYKDMESDVSSSKTAHGDYVTITEEQQPETTAIFISSKEFPTVTTLETVHEEWDWQTKQPDHNNVYQYSHLPYIRELRSISEKEIQFLGKTALSLEYTFSNWSKFWKERAIMFPRGNRIYTIKIREERDVADRFLPVYEHVLETFTMPLPKRTRPPAKRLNSR